MPALMAVAHMVCGSSKAYEAKAGSQCMQNTMYSGAHSPIVKALLSVCPFYIAFDRTEISNFG